MSIYKECDIRGIYGKELQAPEAYEIGRAIGTMLTGKTVVVCGDARYSTPILKAELVKGLLGSGAHILDISLAPTPVFYFAKHHLSAYGGVMVTASHNPWPYNGFKVALGIQPITPADIQEIHRRVTTKDFVSAQGTYAQVEVEAAYEAAMSSLVHGGHCKVVIDAGGGATSLLAPAIFTKIGYDVVPLYCQFDGKFSNRNPNPAVFSNLTKLQQVVMDSGADLGMAFDGDGDRVVFVDETGAVITSEKSLCILMEHLPKDRRNSVVYDLKSSSIVEKTALSLGITPMMERSGHAFIKKTFLSHHSALGGEISGHFFFQELGHDDGIYCGLKMAEILSQSGKTMSALGAHIPTTLITPDIRIPWPYALRDNLMSKVKSMEQNYPITTLDGVRVQFPYGWLLIRKSVTEEGITLRIEAETQKKLEQIVEILLSYVPELSEKFSEICPCNSLQSMP